MLFFSKMYLDFFCKCAWRVFYGSSPCIFLFIFNFENLRASKTTDNVTSQVFLRGNWKI